MRLDDPVREPSVPPGIAHSGGVRPQLAGRAERSWGNPGRSRAARCVRRWT